MNNSAVNNSPTNETDLPDAQNIHLADETEIEQVCNILASAFTNDPLLGWLSGHPKIYGELFRFEAEALYKHHGQVYINGEETGAAMWLPGGVSAKAPFHWRSLAVIWGLVSTGGFSSLRRGAMLGKIMAEHRPKEPHFYLHAIGASLENQGRGIGSALMKAGLSACDQQGMMAYLESSNEKNNPLYERYGFEIIGEEVMPEGGPRIWFMQRGARISACSAS